MPIPEDIPRGIAWMVVTGFFFVAVTATVRTIGTDVPVIQSAFLRYLFGLLLVLPSLWTLVRQPPGRADQRLFAARGLAHGIGVMLWFYAMVHIPIAEVTAIGYTAPIFVTIGAALFLGERLRARRVIAVVIGFLGALVILRPGFQSLVLGQLAQLLAAPLFATSYLLAKRLTGHYPSSTIVAVLSLTCTIVLLPGALYQWETPSLHSLALLALTALLATAGHYAMMQAFRYAPITVTQPIGILQLVWAALIGIAVFGEPIDPFVLLGGTIIVGSATYIAHREAQLARAAKARLSVSSPNQH